MSIVKCLDGWLGSGVNDLMEKAREVGGDGAMTRCRIEIVRLKFGCKLKSIWRQSRALLLKSCVGLV